MSDARSCGALLSFAEEQLSRVPSHSTVNLSHIVSHAHLQNAGLIMSSATRSFDAWFDSSRGCALREGSAREASGV